MQVEVPTESSLSSRHLALRPLLASSAMKDTERYGHSNLVFHCFITDHQTMAVVLLACLRPFDCHLSVFSNRNEVTIAEIA